MFDTSCIRGERCYKMPFFFFSSARSSGFAWITCCAFAVVRMQQQPLARNISPSIYARYSLPFLPRLHQSWWGFDCFGILFRPRQCECGYAVCACAEVIRFRPFIPCCASSSSPLKRETCFCLVCTNLCGVLIALEYCFAHMRANSVMLCVDVRKLFVSHPPCCATLLYFLAHRRL